MKLASHYLTRAGLAAGLLFTASAWAQDEAAPAQPAPEPVPPVNPTEALDQLKAAYQKEYAFLNAQLRDLQKRVADFEAQASNDESTKEAQIDRVEGEWIGLQSEAERMQALMTDAQRELEGVDDARTTLEATFLQADSTLEPYGVEELGSEAYLSSPDGERIGTVFGHAVRLLDQVGTMHTKPGAYFLRDGTEVQGEIVRVGNIAAYGHSAQGSGALAPAGEGRLKVWSVPAEATADALAAGSRPDQLGIFLFENETRAIEEKEGKTILSVINSGGTIGWIIVGLGILALVLVVLRFFFLRGASASTSKIVDSVGGKVRAGDIDGALEACKNFKGSTARVVGAAVRNLERDRDHLEDIISEAILHESSHLNRFGAIILVIAAVAPLLGLLGTVTGMITTFDIITEFGTGDPKLLSGGISIALVTTELGLAVAIPALLFGNVLSGWAESIKDGMEKGALRVINQFKEHRRTA
ncbi:flagellar motor protein MotA [Marinihelvus fidelis]|uniref:Flagellar motor protein MotA n=1 Tax=Marinihelvus fidelis TaxID=2613842 RepID=A0A5N0T6U1_9GAMM|nr:MotA/TolQ/ExbB proton channel family protein [Marinihelvus fidelis]KAA9129857.1 flagellar motor protein MotA [Marinihelvus fidelis]